MSGEKSCAMLPIIKSHIVTLMKVFKKELKDEYYMNDATKCLYTAVLIMSIYMGEYGLAHIQKCDVDHVQKYYREMREAARKKNPDSQFDPSALFVKECASSMFSSSKSSRYLYYVMTTNAQVSMKGAPNGATVQFPGHVCVIEKFPNGKYHLYQSYINHYDLDGHYNLNKGSFSIAQDTLKLIMNELLKLYETGIWTESTASAWKKFTHVDASEFIGRDFKGKSFFCYRKVPIKTCTNRLLGTLRRSLKDKDIDSDLALQIKKITGQLKEVNTKI